LKTVFIILLGTSLYTLRSCELYSTISTNPTLKVMVFYPVLSGLESRSTDPRKSAHPAKWAGDSLSVLSPEAPIVCSSPPEVPSVMMSVCGSFRRGRFAGRWPSAARGRIAIDPGSTVESKAIEVTCSVDKVAWLGMESLAAVIVSTAIADSDALGFRRLRLVDWVPAKVATGLPAW
jgi:hypothetical protein